MTGCLRRMRRRCARNDGEWRHEYMTLQLRDQENREIGREEGRVEGREEGRVEGYKELMGRK